MGSEQGGCREPVPKARARGLRADRLGDLGKVQTQRQANRGSKLLRREVTHLVTRGVVQPSHGSLLRGSEEGGRHHSKGIIARGGLLITPRKDTTVELTHERVRA